MACSTAAWSGLDGGLRREERLSVGIQLALGNGMSFRFGNITLYIQLGIRHLRLGLRQLSLGLIEDGLEWTGIDLEQELTFSDKSPFPIILANQVTTHLRLNLCVDESFERSDPLALNRDILLNDRCDFDHRWRRRSGCSHLAVAATERIHQQNRGN